MKTKSLICLLLGVALLPTAYAQNPSQPNTIKGFYDVLYIEENVLRSLANDNYVFVTAVDADDNLTLRGWQTTGLHNRSFATDPAVTLKRAYRSEVPFGVNSLFGGLAFSKRSSKLMLRTLRTRNHNVVAFVPTTKPGYFAYQLYTSKGVPTSPGYVSAMATRTDYVETDLYLNPSPPKKIYEH